MSALEGGVAVVTGGAGTGAGLGRGLVRQLAAHGMSVAVLDIDEAAASALADELQAEGVRAIACAADVRDSRALEAAAASVRETLGSCNVLCCHVGDNAPGRVDTIPIEQWRAALDIGVIGTVATVSAFLPLLRAASGLRRIVLTSSVAALAPGPFQGPYRAVKAAVTSIGETLDLELSSEGIGTTIVFPSGMATSEALAAMGDARGLAAEIDRLPEGFREVASALHEELASDPTDLATGGDAAAPVVEAILAGRRYVITHGASVERNHRRRQRLIDEAFAELRERGFTTDGTTKGDRWTPSNA